MWLAPLEAFVWPACDPHNMGMRKHEARSGAQLTVCQTWLDLLGPASLSVVLSGQC